MADGKPSMADILAVHSQNAHVSASTRVLLVSSSRPLRCSRVCLRQLSATIPRFAIPRARCPLYAAKPSGTAA
eukprot:1991839-Rhodomonas_salina.4